MDARGAKPGDPVSVGIRPEHARLAAANTAGTLTGVASHIEQLGEASYLYLESAELDGFLTVQQDGDTVVAPGQPVTVTLPEQHCHLFDGEERAFARHFVDQTTEKR